MKLIKLLPILSVLLLVGAGCTKSPAAYSCVQASDCQLGIIEQCAQPCPSCDNLDATDDEVEAFSRSWCQAQREIAKEANPDISACAACIGSIENSPQVEIKCVNFQCKKKLLD